MLSLVFITNFIQIYKVIMIYFIKTFGFLLIKEGILFRLKKAKYHNIIQMLQVFRVVKKHLSLNNVEALQAHKYVQQFNSFLKPVCNGEHDFIN